jgi:uncharacterized protein (TIRG00374 family)
MKRIAWLAVGLLAAVLIPLLLGGGDIFQRLRSFPFPLLMAMFGMIILCWGLNTLRLRLLLGDSARQLTVSQSLGLIMASEFAYCATPGGSGGPLTLMAVLSRSGVGPAKSSAVFATDQLSDLLFFLLALVGIMFYALFHSLSERMEWLLGFSAVLVVGSLSLFIGFARFHRQVIKFNGRVLRRFNAKASTCRRWARKVLHFRDALAETWKMPRQRLLAVFALTCVHWGLRYSILYLALQGLGVNVQWAWTFLIQMLSLTAGQFSLLPGGAGTAELTSAALLAPMVGKSTAAAAILIWRAVTYYFYLVVGGPIFLLMVGKPLLKRLMRFNQA